MLGGAGAIGLWGIGIPSAGAQQSAQELQAIQAQIEQMQATIKALQKQVQDAQAQAGAAKAAAESGGKSDIDLKVKWKGAPEFSSSDGKFKMPNPKLPKLSFTDGFKKHMDKKPEITKFMMEKVVPEMATLLGTQPYDPKTQKGFGCAGCHVVGP